METSLKFENEYGIECDDLLRSDKYIQEFHSTIMNSKYSVYAITGAWGTGKTCFVKMWENKLKSDGDVFVHIDAFRMDYETEPFIMLVKAFKEFMDKKNVDRPKKQAWLDKAKSFFSLKNFAKLGFNIIIDKTIGTETVKEFVNGIYNSCFDAASSEKSLYDELVSAITEITKEFEKPVYIIIDELDRCRPDFALETLERIKHIFHVKNVKFVLVYNKEVIASMISNKYGTSIDTKKYLTKFVEKEHEHNIANRLYSWFRKEIESTLEKFPNDDMVIFLERNYEPILNIAESFGLSLRDIQQILANLKRYKNISNLDGFTVIVSVELLKCVNERELNNMIDYYNVNKSFATNNAPERNTFAKIFKIMTKKLPDDYPKITADAAFYVYVKELS